MIISENISDEKIEKPVKILSFISCLFLWGLAIFSLDSCFLGSFGRGVDNFTIPSKAGEFIKNLKLDFHLYNDDSLGGSICFLTKKSIFKDKREWLYNRHTEKDLKRLEYSPDFFEELERRWNIFIAVIDHRKKFKKDFISRFIEDKNWHLVYIDHISLIFIKSHKKTSNIIEKFEIFDEPKKEIYLEKFENEKSAIALFYRADALLDLDFIKRAQKDIKSLGNISSHSAKYFYIQRVLTAKYFYLKGKLALKEWKLKFANDYFEKSWKREKSAETLWYLIFINLRLNDYKKTEFWCKKDSFEFPDLWVFRAELAYLQKDYSISKKYLEIALKKYPYFKNAKDYLRLLEEQESKVNIQEYIDIGRNFFRQKRYYAALKIFNRILDKSENCARAYLEIGKIQLKLKKMEKSCVYLRKALQYSNPATEEYISATCYFAIALARLGKWEDGLSVIKPVLSKNVDRLDIREALAEIEDSAISILKNKIARNPENIENIFTLSSMYERKKMLSEAIEILEDLKNISSKNLKKKNVNLARLYYKKGKDYINNKKVKEGIKYLKRSLNIVPYFISSHLLLGAISIKKKDWEEADKYFSKVLKINPGDIRAKKGIALIEYGKGLEYQKNKKYILAYQKLKKYLELAPKDDEKKRIKQITENLEKAIEKYYLNLGKGVESIKKKDYIKAVKFFKICANLIPGNADAYFNISQVYLMQKDEKKAIIYLKECLNIDSGYKKAFINLGYILYNLNQKEEAFKYFKTYLKKFPNSNYVSKIKLLLENYK